MRNIFGYTYQKLEKGGSLFKDKSSEILKLKSLISQVENGELPVANPNGVKIKLQEILYFQQGGVRNTTMKSGYKSVTKPRDIKPENGAKRTLYTEKIADTDNSAYGKNSGNVDYQETQRSRQQELVNKYGMLDDDTLIGKHTAGEIDKETGQLLSDAYNRDLALKNNQTTYKRKFNSAIGLNPELDYLAANKMSFNTPEPVKVTKDVKPQSKSFKSSHNIVFEPGVRGDGLPNYNDQGMKAWIESTGADGQTVRKRASMGNHEIQTYWKSLQGHAKDLVNKPHSLDSIKHKSIINSAAPILNAADAQFKKANIK
jgi:hypothetical protein